MMESLWMARTLSGDSLVFTPCKGGYFSTDDRFGLKITGKTTQKKLTGKNKLPVATMNIGSSGAANLSAAALTALKGLTVGGKYIYSCTPYYMASGSGDGSISLYDSTTGRIFMTLQNGVVFTVTAQFQNISKAVVTGYPQSGSYAMVRNMMIRPYHMDSTYEAYCGGIPAPNKSYPQSIRRVKAGTTVSCGTMKMVTPCDLYGGDIWFPMTGKVERHSGRIASYNGEAVPAGYTSTTGGLDTGAEVVYLLTNPVTETYDPQPVYVPHGTTTARITQSATEERANLSATMLVRR